MARLIIIGVGAFIAILGLFFIDSDDSGAPKPEPRTAESRLTRISPSKESGKLEPKPYLMLHIEDLKKCFPGLLSDARSESLVTLDDIMVEVEKVFLPEKKVELFHQLKYLNERGEEMVLRVIRGKPKGPELFYINDKKEWQEQTLDASYKTWPTKALFRHFSADTEVIEEEEHFSQRGRGGEQIKYKVRSEQVTELNLYSPAQNRRLTCNLREPKAILCICDLDAGEE